MSGDTPGERPPLSTWPRFAAYAFYPLSAGAALMLRLGWLLRAHVLVLGPIFIAIGWREPAQEPSNA